MALTPAETLTVRRHAGYPAVPASGDPVAASVAALSAEAEGVLRTLYLPALDQAESAILNSSELLGTKKAAVWERNPAELAERGALYRAQRMALCAFLRIEPGPGIDALVILTPGTDPGTVPGAGYPPDIFVV